MLEREVRAPFPPAWMVRALMAPLAALAHRRGHAERYATVEVLAFAAERHGAGAPSGLQNRQAAVARSLVGSIPAPLRLAS